jgi:hypothetical protein
MSAITGDALSTYGGPYANYGTGVVDPTTDMDAGAGNKLMAAVSGMSLTRLATWVKFTPNGSSAPVLNLHSELWKNVGLAIPVVARSTTGTYTITYPTQVSDEITIGNAGYTGLVTLNLQAGFGQSRAGSASVWIVSVVPTSANVLTAYLYLFSAGSFALNDPTTVAFDVWGQ